MNIKHHELNSRYHNNKERYQYNLASMRDFINRVVRYGRNKEDAMIKKTVHKAKIKGMIDDQGRTCNKCNEYKTWDNYTRNAEGPYKKDCVCISCKKQIKLEYRTRTNGAKDKEYKIRSRIIEIGSLIIFPGDIEKDLCEYGDIRRRKVLGYGVKKGYMIQCLLTGFYSNLDTNNSNPNRKKRIKTEVRKPGNPLFYKKYMSVW